ncbi:hypothetical protein F4818DRAFT_283893 [Hypoxylon cercidicola]|nr:hypothetical protein F4818DRAFT_283893 [Hypoxylon cercidicola]
MEMYQQVFTPAPYRAALDEMIQRGNRGWVIDVSPISPSLPPSLPHPLPSPMSHRIYLAPDRTTTSWWSSTPAASQSKCARTRTSKPCRYVNLVRTVVTLGWIEKYVDGGWVVNAEDGKLMYPS